MASTDSSHVPLLSLYTFRLRKSKSCQRMKLWPLHVQKLSVCDIKLSCAVRTYWDFSLRCASGTFSPVSSSETDNVRRSKTLSNSGRKNVDGFEKELQELFDKVKQMIAMGKKDEAKDLLLANYEAANERLHEGQKGIEEAALIDVIALGYMALGDHKFVGTLLGTGKIVFFL